MPRGDALSLGVTSKLFGVLKLNDSGMPAFLPSSLPPFLPSSQFQHLPARFAPFPRIPSSSPLHCFLIWLRESVTYGGAATARAVDIWREEEEETKKELFGR